MAKFLENEIKKDEEIVSTPPVENNAMIFAGGTRIPVVGAADLKEPKIGGETLQYIINNNGIFSFGDGSDGEAIFDGVNAVTGASLAGSTYTLTRDVYYTSATVLTGVTINPAGYRIFGTGTLTLNGTAKIARNGNNGSNASSVGVGSGAAGGAALADGYLKGSPAGKTGGDGASQGANNGGAGTVGANTSNSIGSNGTGGGAGGNGGEGDNVNGNGGSAGGGGAATASNVTLIANWHLATLLDVGSTGATLKFDNSGGGGSGGGGGGGGTSAGTAVSGRGGGGGGSGSSGGIIAIYFRNIVLNVGTSITATGGNGGNGFAGQNATAGTGNAGGGGGGAGAAGGNGGQIILVYNTLINNGSLTVTGGTGGTGAAGGTGVGGGGTGATGGNGTAGTTGTIRQFQISL